MMSNAMMELAKSKTNAEQHPEVKLQLTDNYSNSYHPKIIKHILKGKQKSRHIFIHEIICLIIMKMKIKNRSRRYDHGTIHNTNNIQTEIRL